MQLAKASFHGLAKKSNFVNKAWHIPPEFGLRPAMLIHKYVLFKAVPFLGCDQANHMLNEGEAPFSLKLALGQHW